MNCFENLANYWGNDVSDRFFNDCKDVDVKISRKDGKGVFAKQKFRAGDVVFSEVPLASHCLYRQSFQIPSQHCSHCLRSYSNDHRIVRFGKVYDTLVCMLLYFFISNLSYVSSIQTNLSTPHVLTVVAVFIVEVNV